MDVLEEEIVINKFVLVFFRIVYFCVILGSYVDMMPLETLIWTDALLDRGKA